MIYPVFFTPSLYLFLVKHLEEIVTCKAPTKQNLLAQYNVPRLHSANWLSTIFRGKCVKYCGSPSKIWILSAKAIEYLHAFDIPLPYFFSSTRLFNPTKTQKTIPNFATVWFFLLITKILSLKAKFNSSLTKQIDGRINNL